ncbi:hypothetical protein VNO77_03021 [Canavalia gladiata]|uniref:Uncharacterized protein n=1 Tax=Canavalia gladiata TaxID=3824 RepID=A0AAN9N0H3_CANGL
MPWLQNEGASHLERLTLLKVCSSLNGRRPHIPESNLAQESVTKLSRARSLLTVLATLIPIVTCTKYHNLQQLEILGLKAIKDGMYPLSAGSCSRLRLWDIESGYDTLVNVETVSKSRGSKLSSPPVPSKKGKIGMMAKVKLSQVLESNAPIKEKIEVDKAPRSALFLMMPSHLPSVVIKPRGCVVESIHGLSNFGRSEPEVLLAPYPYAEVNGKWSMTVLLRLDDESQKASLTSASDYGVILIGLNLQGSLVAEREACNLQGSLVAEREACNCEIVKQPFLQNLRDERHFDPPKVHEPHEGIYLQKLQKCHKLGQLTAIKPHYSKRSQTCGLHTDFKKGLSKFGAQTWN